MRAHTVLCAHEIVFVFYVFVVRRQRRCWQKRNFQPKIVKSSNLYFVYGTCARPDVCGN